MTLKEYEKIFYAYYERTKYLPPEANIAEIKEWDELQTAKYNIHFNGFSEEDKK